MDIIRPIFITLVCDSKYDHESHKFADVFTAKININKINSITDFIPDDEDFTGKAGSEIFFDDGSFVCMEYTPDQIEGVIEDAILRTETEHDI